MRFGSGVPTHFCPIVFLEAPKIPTAIWGDSLVGLLWGLFKSYGNSQNLSQHLESMRAWIHKGTVQDGAISLWDEDRAHPATGWTHRHRLRTQETP